MATRLACPIRIGRRTWRIVKFSSTLFIMYFSGKHLSLWTKLIMYSHMGDRRMQYKKRPFSKRGYSVWKKAVVKTEWIGSISCVQQNSYCQTSNISHNLIGNKLVDHSDVAGALPVGAEFLGEIWSWYKRGTNNGKQMANETPTSTFSTTCLPKEQTLVEHWIVMFSELSYLE